MKTNPFFLKSSLAVLLCFTGFSCARDGRENLGAGRESLGQTGRDDAAGTIVIPPDSPELGQFEIEPAAEALIPENEVVAPGKVEFDVNRISRVLLPVPGRITRVLARLGDSVAAGQPLFTIDSPDAYAALSELKQAQASVAQAHSTLTRAKADHGRTVDLFEHMAIARKEVLASENAAALAQAGLDQAEAGLEQARRRLAILGFGDGDPAEPIAVRSPLAGKVIDLAVTAGEYRNDTTTPVITVADLSVVWVTSAVPENSIRFIEVGERVEIELLAYPGEVFDARVAKIADTLDPATRTVQVRAELRNPQGRFKPEMFGRIRHAHTPRALPVVPARAILRRGTGTFVYVERSRGTFERVPVTIGKPREDRIPILSGIRPGDRIVSGGGMILSGREVR